MKQASRTPLSAGWQRCSTAPRARLGTPTSRYGDVIAFKIVGGRPRDLRDIEELAELNPGLRWGRVVDMLSLVGVKASDEELMRAVRDDDLRSALKALARAVRAP